MVRLAEVEVEDCVQLLEAAELERPVVVAVLERDVDGVEETVQKRVSNRKQNRLRRGLVSELGN